MTEYVYLTGSEDVKSAGNAMTSAAQTFTQAASSISESLMRHERMMEEFVIRMELILEPVDG